MLSSNKSLKFIIKAIGYVITVICLFYILKQILALKIDLGKSIESSQFYLYIILFSFLHTLPSVAAAFAWKIITEFFCRRSISFKIILQVYFKSNIAKYLPGNVMHYAGRTYLGSKFGMKHSDISMSSVVEIIFVVITTAILTILSLLLSRNLVPNELVSMIQSQPELIYVLLGIIFLIICLLLIKKNYLVKISKTLFSKRFITLFIKIITIYSFIFIFSGLVLVLIFIFLFNLFFQVDDIMRIIIISILSSFLGYITPGAPGGIGVRETGLVIMLSPLFGKDNTLIAALVFRLITTLSDVIAFFIGYFFSIVYKESKISSFVFKLKA